MKMQLFCRLSSEKEAHGFKAALWMPTDNMLKHLLCRQMKLFLLIINMMWLKIVMPMWSISGGSGGIGDILL